MGRARDRIGYSLSKFNLCKNRFFFECFCFCFSSCRHFVGSLKIAPRLRSDYSVFSISSGARSTVLSAVMITGLLMNGKTPCIQFNRKNFIVIRRLCPSQKHLYILFIYMQSILSADCSRLSQNSAHLPLPKRRGSGESNKIM